MRLSRPTGFLNRDDLQKSPSEAEGRSPFGNKVGEDDLSPSGEEKGRAPSGENEVRFMVRGDLKEAAGPLSAGGR